MRQFKVLLLDNCYDCKFSGLHNYENVCSLTGTVTTNYDSDLCDDCGFPPDCPLKDYTGE